MMFLNIFYNSTAACKRGLSLLRLLSRASLFTPFFAPATILVRAQVHLRHPFWITKLCSFSKDMLSGSDDVIIILFYYARLAQIKGGRNNRNNVQDVAKIVAQN